MREAVISLRNGADAPRGFTPHLDRAVDLEVDAFNALIHELTAGKRLLHCATN